MSLYRLFWFRSPVPEREGGQGEGFDFPGNLSAADRVGIVEELADDDGYVFTIEGNTSTSDQSNGGMVMRRKRKRSLIAGAFPPAYEAEKAAAPEPETPDPDADETLYGEPEPEAGDSVTFNGGSQFSSPYDDAEAVPATVVACSRGAAHPYHLSGAGVEGWGDFNDVKLVAPKRNAPARRRKSGRGSAWRLPRVRSGPGVEYATEGSLSTGTALTVVEERDGWGRFAADRWISLSYTKRL